MLLSDTPENSQEAAIWLTGQNNPIRGVYNCQFNKSQMIVYYSWPDNADKSAATVAIDVLAIFLNSYECWEKMKEEVEKYSYIPVKAVISFEKYNAVHEQIDAQWILRQESRNVRETLDILDQKEYRHLSIVEFIRWWKIGRLNTKATSFVYTLSKEINNFVQNNINFQSFKRQIENNSLC